MSDMNKENISKANGLSSDFKNKVVKAEDRIEELSHSMGQMVGHKASEMVGATSNYLNSGRAFVIENPTKAVAIAASAGIVTGALLTLLLRKR